MVERLWLNVLTRTQKITNNNNNKPLLARNQVLCARLNKPLQVACKERTGRWSAILSTEAPEGWTSSGYLCSITQDWPLDPNFDAQRPILEHRTDIVESVAGSQHR